MSRANIDQGDYIPSTDRYLYAPHNTHQVGWTHNDQDEEVILVRGAEGEQSFDQADWAERRRILGCTARCATEIELNSKS